jgi:hypothetical protein
MNICGNDVKVQGWLARIGRVAAEGFEYLKNAEETHMVRRSGRPQRIQK